MIRTSIAAILLAISAAALAQSPAPPTIVEADSRQLREELHSLLRKYPPHMATVLKLDPTLFSNETYMKNYPALSAFVAQHPEVVHNPAYFLGGELDLVEEGQMYSAWHQMMGDAAALLVFLVVTSVLIWIIKTVIEQRR